MWIQDTTTYGPVMGAFGDDEIRRAVEATGSHFFSRDTMRWFGTRNLAMIDGIVMVGLDSKAPEPEMRYWARVFREDGSAERVASASDRRAITREARRIAAELKASGRDAMTCTND